MAKIDITAELIRERLNYDADTGVFTWRTSPRVPSKVGRVAGSHDFHGYLQLNIGGNVLKVHRLVWLHVYGEWPRGHIDHINGVKDDNRLSNLRVVTNAINCQNKRAPLPSNKSGFLGVSWQAGAWRAKIQLNGKQHHLGRFRTPEEAHCAYLTAKRRLHEGCSI